ncbi:hypothetical protein KHS38_11925 [Mucilaginibacter sp. Bleaf8]|uniref:hypothetical protein n=1 Tax=Mucilaginibacter sp. Bleaf8 TaxID=2834430 RepID=UPI001BCF8775|nr:hypothetical protein [Mucilaginibacter sp. Bleaf8]MBS7565114.1 hypothetical protein [Mucilaginibacter sp. Bleaf8]
MENQFAKLFEFETGQLLVIMDYDAQEDRDQICVRTFRNGITMETKVSFPEGESCQKDFDAFDALKARESFDGMQRMLRK